MEYDEDTETLYEDEEDDRNFVEEEAEVVVDEEAAYDANVENEFILEYSNRLIQVAESRVDSSKKKHKSFNRSKAQARSDNTNNLPHAEITHILLTTSTLTVPYHILDSNNQAQYIIIYRLMFINFLWLVVPSLKFRFMCI